MDCADCFVALKKTLRERLTRWERHTDLPQEMKAHYHRYRVKPDRIFEIDEINQVFFLEHDNGTEENLDEEIRPKLENFIRFSDDHKGQGLITLFTVKGYRYRTAEERKDELLNLFAEYKRGNQFLAVLHSDFCADPLAPVQTPTSTISLSSLNY